MADAEEEIYDADLQSLSQPTLKHLRTLSHTGDGKSLAEFFIAVFARLDKNEAETRDELQRGGKALIRGGDTSVRQREKSLRASGYKDGELRQLAADGPLERARELLALHLNPNAVAESLADWGPLHYAAQVGHAEMCALLVEHGADLFAQDRNNETALMQAAYWGQHATVKLLREFERDKIKITQNVQQSEEPACVSLEQSPVEWHSEGSVSIICSAPEFSRNGDKVMEGLFKMCSTFGEHVKFGYDWGGSTTAEPADMNPNRVVYDCCHSLSCTVGTGPGQCPVQGAPIKGPVDWRNPKSVAGSMWFPKYKTKVMGSIQAEAQRDGITHIEMAVINGGPVSQLEKCTMPNIITGAVQDLQKKSGMDIGFAGEGRGITVFMRPMEYDEFFMRFHGIDGALIKPLLAALATEPKTFETELVHKSKTGKHKKRETPTPSSQQGTIADLNLHLDIHTHNTAKRHGQRNTIAIAWWVTTPTASTLNRITMSSMGGGGIHVERAARWRRSEFGLIGIGIRALGFIFFGGGVHLVRQVHCRGEFS
jgi:hypothetical protein